MMKHEINERVCLKTIVVIELSAKHGFGCIQSPSANYSSLHTYTQINIHCLYCRSCFIKSSWETERFFSSESRWPLKGIQCMKMND